MKGNKNYFELVGGLSYQGFELLSEKYSKCMKEIKGIFILEVSVSEGLSYWERTVN